MDDLQQLSLIESLNFIFYSRHRRINSFWRSTFFSHHFIPVNSLEKIVALNLIDSLSSQPLFWIFSQKPLQQASCSFGNYFWEFQFCICNVIVKFLDIFGVERRLTHYHFIYYSSQTEEIALFAHSIFLQHFWRNICRRATKTLCNVVFSLFTQPKINDFQVPQFIKQNVLRLQITINDVQTMQIL
jgi:hypothetical protein